MGFDMLEGDHASTTDRNMARWRETEEESRKAAGQEGRDGQEQEGVQEEGELPEPDAEGRRIAESEEVRFRVLRMGCWCPLIALAGVLARLYPLKLIDFSVLWSKVC